MNTRADQGKAQFGMTPFPQRFRAFIWPATTVTVQTFMLYRSPAEYRPI